MKFYQEIILAVIIVAFAYFIGMHHGAQNEQWDAKEKALKKQFDSLESVLIISEFRQRQLNDSIKKKDAYISELRTERLKIAQDILTTKKYYERKIKSFDNAPVARLDSFFRARYPVDSLSGRTSR